MERHVDRDFEKAKAELTRGGGLVSRRFEWCKNWRDIFEEWDEILWVLPKAERAKAKPPARSPLTADELRRLIPGAPDTALAALVLKAQLIAHPNHWRPRLVVDNPRVNASSSKLTAKDLREAISLGVKLAEEEALFKLTMKAKQVAEHDRRRPRLVIDYTKIEPRQA